MSVCVCFSSWRTNSFFFLCIFQSPDDQRAHTHTIKHTHRMFLMLLESTKKKIARKSEKKNHERNVQAFIRGTAFDKLAPDQSEVLTERLYRVWGGVPDGHTSARTRANGSLCTGEKKIFCHITHWEHSAGAFFYPQRKLD